MGLLAAATLLMGSVHAQSLVEDASVAQIARVMSEAAQRLLAATDSSRTLALQFPFDETLRADWHYTPRNRAGVALKDMGPREREAARALLAAPLSGGGLAKVEDVMALEHVLRAIETFAFMRTPENYAIALYGDPRSAAWGWRIEGHHLSLHFTMAGDRVVSTAPQFIGANPATVPKAVQGGPLVGTRVLGREADLARALLASLTATQRRTAIVSERAYGDIVSRNTGRATPLEHAGIAAAALDATQRATLAALIDEFVRHLKPSLATARRERVGRFDADTLSFAWAGGINPNAGHYFRIQGERFLIEYDNATGNHVHSVWRDFDGDFGRDLLAEHYRTTRGTQHRHPP